MARYVPQVGASSQFESLTTLVTGYGATTFPGLTEAILYEKNVTLVNEEAKRLEVLIGELATVIDPDN